MKLWDMTKNIFQNRSDDQYDDQYDYVDDYDRDDRDDEEEEGHLEPVHTAEPVRPAMRSNVSGRSMSRGNVAMRIEVFEPTSFDDGKEITEIVKTKGPLVVNFSETDQSVMSRLFDFLSGAMHAIGGSFVRVSEAIIIVSPPNVEVKEPEAMRTMPPQSFTATAPKSWADMEHK